MKHIIIPASGVKRVFQKPKVEVNLKEQRQYCEWIAKEFNIRQQEDWYSLHNHHFDVHKDGAKFLKRNDHSLWKILQSSYPEFEWYPWKFPVVAASFWISSKNQRKYFDWLADALGISLQDEWYRTTIEEVKKTGSTGPIGRYSFSVVRALSSVYPEFEWHGWKFRCTSQNYWDKIEHQRKLFDWVAEELHLKTYEDWNRVTALTLREHGAFGLLLTRYNGSLHRALSNAFPEFEWHWWKMDSLTQSYLDDVSKHREFFDWLAYETGIEVKEDWHKLGVQDICEPFPDAQTIMNCYNNSLYNAMRSVYPEFLWYPWNFYLPSGYWDNLQHQRMYFDGVAEILGIEKLDDWHNVKVTDVIDTVGYGLIQAVYNNSLIKALSCVYPHHPWEPWNFTRVYRKFWNEKDHHRRYFDWLAKKLNIQHPTDWLSVKHSDIVGQGGNGLLQKYGGSVAKALSAVYTEFDWTAFMGVSDGQKHAWNVLRHLFRESILLNYKHPQMHHSVSHRSMELDIYIPSMKLAFEYQGGQHYLQTTMTSSALATQQKKDEEKRQMCKQLGITLIEIPYWWDLSTNQIIATINKHRPDIHLPPIMRENRFMGMVQKGSNYKKRRTTYV